MTNCKINYTAKDSNVLELSKIGFNKTFNTELDNNIGNINELTKKTLDKLNWSLDSEKTEFIKQWNEQPIFICTINVDIEMTDNTIINSGQVICLFYNEILEEKKENLTILKPKKINDGDSFDQIISNNSINNILENVYYYTLKEDTIFTYEELNNVHYKKPSFIDSNTNNFILLLGTRAKQLICKPKMHYSKPLNRYVYEYQDINDNNKIYYGYEKSEYSTDSLISNLLLHGQDFINLNNWYVSNVKNASNKTIKSSMDLCITNEDVAIITVDDVDEDIEIIDGNYSFLTFETENN